MSLAVIDHGCRLNIAEGAAIRTILAGAQDLVVVNSCAVTAEAVATARKAVRRARRAHPEARIVVTGCAAETELDTFRSMPEVDLIVSNLRKLDPALYPSSVRQQAPEADHTACGERHGPLPSQGRREGHARAFLPVQNGCDHRCTFCIIPFGRGPSRSVPAGGVIEEVRAVVAAGAKEVVLTGVDLTSYGGDLPGAPSLGRLVERILRHVPELERLRLSSLDPCEVDDRLIGLFADEPRLMPHVHLSLQAGDDLVLKRMKRRHSRGQAVALVERLKAARPGLSIGADLIAGFPTEDEAMAANSRALIDECDIVFAHIFPYSLRSGTPAARMPQVEREVVRARAARLREAGEARRARWLQDQIGTVQKVLVELDGTSGHAEHFAKVVLPAGAGANSIVAARITAVSGDSLMGVA